MADLDQLLRVRSGRGDPALGQMDDAPDDGTFNYTFAAGGPDIREVGTKTSPAWGRAPDVSSSSSRRARAAGRARRRFGAEAGVVHVHGEARYEGAARNGRGACTYAIPKLAKGKKLSVVLTVSYQGASKTVQLAYKVR